MLISLIKHADRVKMACLAQLVNVIAPIMTEDGGPAWRQTIFYPYAHAARFGQGTALRLNIQSPVYDDKEFDAVPYLESVAVWNQAEDSVTVFALNRNLDAPLRLEADARAFQGYRVLEHIAMTSDDLRAFNTRENPNRVTPAAVNNARLDDGQLSANLAPASWNVIRLGK